MTAVKHKPDEPLRFNGRQNMSNQWPSVDLRGENDLNDTLVVNSFAKSINIVSYQIRSSRHNGVACSLTGLFLGIRLLQKKFLKLRRGK